jgi:hypothetical protein
MGIVLPGMRPARHLDQRAQAHHGLMPGQFRPGQPSGGCASENANSSAQKPPVSGTGARAYVRAGEPATERSTASSRSASPSLFTVTVFTVTVNCVIV